jgi:hypothetical protein
MGRVAADDFGFLTVIQVFDGPDLVDSFFNDKGILGY